MRVYQSQGESPFYIQNEARGYHRPNSERKLHTSIGLVNRPSTLAEKKEKKNNKINSSNQGKSM